VDICQVNNRENKFKIFVSTNYTDLGRAEKNTLFHYCMQHTIGY